MKGTSRQVARGLAIGVVGLAMVFALGCRKSKSARDEARREELNKQRENELRAQEASSANRQQYEHAKQLIAQRRYDEAWKEFEDVAARDENIKFDFDLYKGEALPEQIFRTADKLSSVENERFSEAYRALTFVRDHIDKKRAKAERKIRELQHRKSGHDLYKRALVKAKTYQRAEALRMLEEVRDNFGDTPYGDMAIQRLRELNPPPPDPPPLD
jgi:hypothetical protein